MILYVHLSAYVIASLTRDNQVRWWADELSKNQYDGIIGLSQGAAMTALLISMVRTSSCFVFLDGGGESITLT